MNDIAASYNPFHTAEVENPLQFIRCLDGMSYEDIQKIQNVCLRPSPSLGRITSARSIGDNIGDMIGDGNILREMSDWLELLYRLSVQANGLRYMTVVFNADMSGSDFFRYRRGAGENMEFLEALGRIKTLECIDIQGFYPVVTPLYLNWAMYYRTRVVDSRPVDQELLRNWRIGTENLQVTYPFWGTMSRETRPG